MSGRARMLFDEENRARLTPDHAVLGARRSGWWGAGDAERRRNESDITL